MRTIIRFSIDNENNSVLRNNLANRLTQADFQRNDNTATYEHQNVTKAELAALLNDFWTRTHQHQGPGRVDHFWMNSDRTALDDIHPEPAV